MAEYPYDARLPQETRLAFAYFEIYRDMPPEGRNMRKTCQHEVNGLKRELKTLGRWGTRDHWQERVKAYDVDQQKIKWKHAKEKRQKDIEKFVDNEMKISERAAAFVMLAVDDLYRDGSTKRNVQQFRTLMMGYSASREHMKEILGFLDEQADTAAKDDS